MPLVKQLLSILKKSKYEERKNLHILSTNILMEETLDKILIVIEGIEKIILDIKKQRRLIFY